MLSALLEAFNPGERRGPHGEWIGSGVARALTHLPASRSELHPSSVAPHSRPRAAPTHGQVQYAGGVRRMSAATRTRLSTVFRSHEMRAKQTQPSADVDELYKHAKVAEPQFHALMAKVAASMGGVQHHDLNAEGGFKELGRAMVTRRHLAHVISGPTKTLESSRRKLKKYNGDASRLNDVVRGTVAVPHVDDLAHAVEHVRRSLPKGWTMHAPENRFVKGRKGDKVNVGDAGGYRDISMVLRSPEGFNTELQITTTHLLHAKEGPGHAMYEESRVLREIKRNRAQEARYQHLIAKSRRLYEGALMQSSRPRPQSQQNVIPPLSSGVRRRVSVRPVVK